MNTNTIRPEHVKKFKSLTKSLDKLMREICRYNPEANLYVEDSWNFNLMKGPTHDDRYNQKALHENVVASELVYKSSGGGW